MNIWKYLISKNYLYIIVLYICQNMRKIYIVTVATESKYYFDYLKKSVKLFGSELVVLGQNEKWKGFNWKFQLTKDFLSKIDPNDIVCFIDGYDVICLRDLNQLIDKYVEIQKRENCKIVIGHDKVVPSMNLLFQYLFFDKCQNKYLNSGSYIGYAKDLLFILNKIDDNLSNDSKKDDQILMTKYCNLNQADFYIDINNEIFIVIADSFNDLKKNITFENKQLIYDSKSKPFFVHGPASTYLDYIIKNIGCEYDENENIKIKNQIYKDFFDDKIYNLTKHIIIEKKNEIFLVILIILLLVILFIKYLSQSK